MAAVVINPPRLRGAPETRTALGYGWGGLARNLAESGGGQKPIAQSKFIWNIIKIGTRCGF